MKDSEIVITGIGVVSPIGIGKNEFYQNLRIGTSGIKPVTIFDTASLSSKMAGEISNFDAEAILGVKGLRNLDRTTKFALCAAKLSLDDAKLVICSENCNRMGVALGSTMGSIRSISEFDKEGLNNGPRAVNPALFPNTVINSPASQISIKFNIKGFNTTISSGFSSSLDALAYARTFLLENRVDAVLVGGAEELCEQTFKGLHKIGFLSGSRGGHELCAPFDKRRNGAILGEGSVIFVIERYESARKRKAFIYAKVDGIGSSFDSASFNRYSLKAQGTKRAILQALQEANKTISDVDYIVSSANSTLDGDVAETRILKEIFTNKNILTSTPKSMIGETYSAGGAFQIATACFALENNLLPPTINYSKEDRRCNIDCVPNYARKKELNTILISNNSPTGQSSAIIISKCPNEKN